MESLRRRVHSAAAAEYPALIAEASFLGTISEVEPSNSKSSHARVWLSEAAALSSALRPGSLVAVPSLPLSLSLILCLVRHLPFLL